MRPLTVSPTVRLDYHSVHTIILKEPCRRRQSRRFPRQPRPFPSLFCSTDFTRHRCGSLAGEPGTCYPRSFGTTQGRLRCTQMASACRFIPQAIVPFDADHELGPPRKLGQVPHAIAGCPTFLTPSTSPGLGAPSQHQELHRCALWRIFSPAFRNGRSTRILRHPADGTYYSIRPGVNIMRRTYASRRIRANTAVTDTDGGRCVSARPHASGYAARRTRPNRSRAAHRCRRPQARTPRPHTVPPPVVASAPVR